MINRTILQGRLTRDIELKQTTSNVPYVSFTVAWSDKYKDSESQLFLDCTAWRNTAEFLSKYFKKGQELVIEGRLETNKYTDKDGNSRSVVRCAVDKVHFCGGKAQNGQEQNGTAEPSGFVEVGEDEDLPF